MSADDPYRSTTLPRLPRLPRVARGVARIEPAPGTGRTLGLPSLAQAGGEPRAFPEPPGDFDGPIFEWAIYFAHQVLGRGAEGELWAFKTPLLGDVSLIGFVGDFSEYEERVVIDVVDIDAPEEQQSQTRAVAIIRRAVLARFGYQYVVIESTAALENPVAMLADALIGVDHSRFGTG